MAVIVGIPARMGASRFPGKPLAPILGLPMIEHVRRRCELALGVDEVFVATCDAEIADVVSSAGGRVVMTSPDAPRAGLRVAEACGRIGVGDSDTVIIVQGDEPLVHPRMIEDAAALFGADANLKVGTLVALATAQECDDKDEVKVVFDLKWRILYMSRSPIPFPIAGAEVDCWKQVAVMPFRASFLRDFQGLAETYLERVESIELLRAVEHGIHVAAIQTMHPCVSVDTESGRLEAERMMEDDALFRRYSGDFAT